MKNKKILLVIIFSLISLYFAYLTFYSFQGFLTLLSKQGTLVVPMLGITFNMFLLPSLVVYGYFYLFKERQDEDKFHFSNGIYLTICSLLSLVFMIIQCIQIFNFGYGPTPLYPFNYIVIDAVGLVLGILNLIKIKKLPKFSFNGKYVLFQAGLYIFVFIAFDRLGSTINTLINGDFNNFLVLLPVHLLNIVGISMLICFSLYKMSKNELHKKNIWLIASLILIVITILSNVYILVMLFGEYATPFMKLLSPFYGFDRITSIPLTISLIPLILVSVSLTSLIKYFLKCKKN